MLGKIVKTIAPFYDKSKNKMSFKSRPALVIGNPNGYDLDYLVLPVSTIKQSQYIDPKYDIEIKRCDFPSLNLTQDSYIRTGKRTPINKANIAGIIGDLKNDYEEKYIEIIATMECFDKELLDKAI